MRLVLDTNVVASALLWSGIPRQLLQAAYERHVALFTCASLLAELADVLGRRKFAPKIAASGFTINRVRVVVLHRCDPVSDLPFRCHGVGVASLQFSVSIDS
jgi:putative PIN family toxin of toxin-antitoxin system